MAGFGSHPGFGGGNSFAPFLAQFAKSMIEKRKQDADDAYRASQVALQQAAQATSAGHLDVRRKEGEAAIEEQKVRRDELATQQRQAEAELNAHTAVLVQRGIPEGEARVMARMKTNPATLAAQEEANADRDKSRDIAGANLELAQENRADRVEDEQVTEYAEALIGEHGSPEAALAALALDNAPNKPGIQRVKGKLRERQRAWSGDNSLLGQLIGKAIGLYPQQLGVNTPVGGAASEPDE